VLVDVEEELLLYRGRWIQGRCDHRPRCQHCAHGSCMPAALRLCLRMKLLQAAGAVGVANFLFTDPQSSSDVILAGSLLGGIVGVSYSLWWFTRTYAGEVRLITATVSAEKRRWLMVSALDFWGNRRDREVELVDWEAALSGMSEEELQKASERAFVRHVASVSLTCLHTRAIWGLELRRYPCAWTDPRARMHHIQKAGVACSPPSVRSG
jgi:hypothetical protein